MSQHETIQNPERNRTRQLVVDALRAAYDVHETLGAEGVNAVQPNQFGDTALVADVQAEAAVLHALEEQGIPTTVHSEEHGIVRLNEAGNGTPRLAVLDGLDGSSLYKKERGVGLYGTMFAVYENDDPTYNEYSVAGIMLHSTGKMLVATRGQGVQEIDVRNGESRPVRTSNQPLSKESLIFVDDDQSAKPDNPNYAYFQTNLHAFGEPLRAAGYTTKRTGSSAAYYALLAMGEANMVGEATRKGNLELATAYALVTEAGGLVVDARTGEDIANQKFLEYGQTSHEPFIVAANQEVLAQVQQILTAK